MNLKNLNDIFERKLLRIPDYQRGYAWQNHQFEDFWEDLIELDKDRVHYTGVITLEPVAKTVWQNWPQDEWLISGLGYKPYYVVDGQQRLTTAMICIQAILETLAKDQLLNHQSASSIREKFIYFKADDGLRSSFIFGYEKDNPSDEYLRTKIFCQSSHTDQNLKTLYTANLLSAKQFFTEKLAKCSPAEVAGLFTKLTQKFKFNLYEVDDEIDVFVTFETMNNRGKPLTNLELLKNRLIYLSTLFEEEEGRSELRSKINNVWKTIYEYLGKDPENQLGDDTFLQNHWIMYFPNYSRKKGNDYVRFLLDRKFTARNVTHPKPEVERLQIKEIDAYVESLRQAIRPWFYIHNPHYPNQDLGSEQTSLLLDRLKRLSFRAFRPLILAAFVAKRPIDEINELLKAVERFNFALFAVSQRRANTGDTAFYSAARQLLLNELTIADILAKIESWVAEYFSPNAFYNHIAEKYSFGGEGFYRWDELRYFLYEHEQWLQKKGKQAQDKLSWEILNKAKKDHATVEHICPQTPTDPYWVDRFGSFSDSELASLTHSLGNLVPLSRAKNRDLFNHDFNRKKNNGDGVGYYNGSSSENEIATKDEWRAAEIFERGMDLLRFMETRWNVSLGDESFKAKLLHLDFLPHEQ